MVSLASNPFKVPGGLCRGKESFLRYGSRVISSIRLSGCLYVILAITAVLFWLIVCSGGRCIRHMSEHQTHICTSPGRLHCTGSPVPS